MRIGLIGASLCLCLVGISQAQSAHAAIRRDLNVPAEELGSALQTVAKDYDFQVLYRTEIVKDLRTKGAVGSLTSDEALGKVLKGTGLTYKYLDSNTVTIMPVGVGVTGAAADQSLGESSTGGGKKPSQDFRVAQVDQGKSSSTSSVGEQRPTSRGNANTSSGGLEEIVVTAQKRSERLQDVPVPVTAISAQSLIDSNRLRLQDYYTSVPGLSVTVGTNYSAPQVAIRGLTTGPTNPTVGIVVDDVPYGSSTNLGGGFQVPDFDPSDLDHIEVLRGPQGTLYGASSLGGLIKFVTVDPSTDGVGGRVQAGISSVYNGAELGYNVRGSVNVPISDTLAVRGSGFYRQDPGYVDNPILHINGINKEDASGGRLSALWRPSELFLLKLSALIQDSNLHGSPDVDVGSGLGDLQQSTVRGSGFFIGEIQAYSATAAATLGSVDLTALSGYSINTVKSSWDYSSAFGAATNTVFGVSGAPLVNRNESKKFSQEIRLSAPIGQRLEWLFGAFYTHESSQYDQRVVAADPTTGAVVGTFADINFPTTYAEYAAFAALTYHFTDRFNVQIGGRESQNSQTYSTTLTGPYVPIFLKGTSPRVPPPVDTTGNSFTYLVTPQFTVSKDLMIYARLASGYRPGGPNSENTLIKLPPFGPDKTQNYEIGIKSDVLDHALSFDASLYYIDWKDIQLQVIDSVTRAAIYVNGSRAKSQGMEFSVESRPVKGLTLAAWVTWDDAALTADFPPNSTVYGVAGNRLPFSSRFSGNFSLNEEFPLTSGITGFVGGTASYVGDRLGVFRATPQRQDFPTYTETDLRTGAKYGSWTLNVFVNNVADRRGLLGGGLGTFNPSAFVYTQPRTLGLTVVKTF